MFRFSIPRYFLAFFLPLTAFMLAGVLVLGQAEGGPHMGLAAGIGIVLWASMGLLTWHLTRTKDNLIRDLQDSHRRQTAEQTQSQALVASLQHKLLALDEANAQLMDSHEALHTIVETSPDGFWRLDAQGQLVDVNPTYCTQSGYTREELIGKKITDLDAQENPDDTARHIDMLMTHGHDKFETRHRRKDGSLWSVEVSTSYRRNAGGEMFAFLRDISEHKQQQLNLELVAHFDALTQLPNRTLLADRLVQKLAHGQRSGQLVLVCMLDLDGFKAVNDQLGHKAGDQLLREVAQRLRDSIRLEDTAARLGGDEFVLLLGSLNNIAESQRALDRILSAVAAPYHVTGRIARVSCSIGVSIFPNEGSDPDQLLRQADEAMYKAKAGGKNRYMLFDPSYELHNKARKGTMLKIAKALNSGQFEMLYQPKINCRLGTVVGVEALVRWHHPILGLMAPAEFVPLVEQEDLVITLGEWVVARVLQDQCAWLAAGHTITVNINVSGRQLLDAGFSRRLGELLHDHPPELLGQISLDIIESVAMEDINAVAGVIGDCHSLAVKVALDDFGTGFSSLVHLKRLAVDELKIDKSFIAAMLASPQDLAIVQSMIGLGTAFRRRISAEGVETLDQVLMLLDLGCDVMQGYHLARPMPSDAVLTWLAAFAPSTLWNLSFTTRPSRDYFELLLAETNHRMWIDRLIADTRDLSEDAASQALLNVSQCRFGRWYDNAKNSQLRHIPEFQWLDALHHDIHQCAHRLDTHRRKGQEAAARADEQVMHQKQSEMQNLLLQIRSKSFSALAE